jgi:hypothetical protein
MVVRVKDFQGCFSHGKSLPGKGTVAKKWHEPRCFVNKNKGTIQGTVQYQIFKTVSLRFPLAGQLLTPA